jgi:Putative Flp pilus-assembly TadE/G-like
VNWWQRAIVDPESRDRGAYAVLYAVLITVIVGIAALVLDLATLRLDRRANRAAADSAAIAAAAELGQAANNPRDACLKAVSYAEANLGITAPSANTCAATFPASDVGVAAACALGTKLIAEEVPAYPAGESPDRDRFRIEISWPVPDDDPLMTDPDRENTTTIVQGISSQDGKPCQRMAVEIVQRGDFSFAGIFGFSGQTTSSRSVALSDVGETGEVAAPLVVLDETACRALILEGSGEVVVAADPAGEYGGAIAVDSDGSDCGGGSNDTVIVASNNNNLWALDTPSGAKAQIQVMSQAFLPSPPGKAYNAADVAGCLGGSSNVDQLRAWDTNVCPIPTPRDRRVTAVPWVDRYNCPADSPAACGHEDDFPPVGPYNFVDQWTSWATTTAPTLPEISQDWDRLEGGECRVTGTDPHPKDVYADCDTLRIDGTLAVKGKLVVRGDVDVQGGCLWVGDEPEGTCSALPPLVDPLASGDDPGPVYIGGDLSVSSRGSLIVRKAFVYVAGNVDVATTGLVSWVGPYNQQLTCVPAASVASAPSGGCFEDLALWANGSTASTVDGPSNMPVDGTLFVPNAEFEFGGGTSLPQDRAQLVAKRLRLRGSGTLWMVPNIKRSTPVPGSGSTLIR